jgi:hypothetical protein
MASEGPCKNSGSKVVPIHMISEVVVSRVSHSQPLFLSLFNTCRQLYLQILFRDIGVFSSKLHKHLLLCLLDVLLMPCFLVIVEWAFAWPSAGTEVLVVNDILGAYVALLVAALRTRHLVATQLLDKGILAFIALPDEGVGFGLL